MKSDNYPRFVYFMRLASVALTAIGFIFFPWVFDVTGMQVILNFLSESSLNTGKLSFLIIPLAIIGMFIDLKDLRLRWASTILIVAAAGYYISITQPGTFFPFGSTSFLGSGFWITILGAVVNIIGNIVSRRFQK